jgi:alpha-glucosidase
MINQLLLALATSAGLTAAVPFPHEPIHISALQRRDADPNVCPGYAASNIVKTDSGLTADLTLAGTACNVYSDDIADLKLVVEYQTGKSSRIITWLRMLRVHIKLTVIRRASSHQDF